MSEFPTDSVFRAWLQHHAVPQMKERGIVFEPGLTDAEVLAAEQKYGFRFPPDLRIFLQVALPVEELNYGRKNSPFPDWRSNKPEDVKYIRYRLSWTKITLSSDAAHCWSTDTWAENIEKIRAAVASVKAELKDAPFLIPVYAHRFIPATPHRAGNPVFSMYGIDTIYYGFDLADYLHNEFEVESPEWAATIPRRFIPFWSKSAGGYEYLEPRSEDES
jgi:hypothetical protein